MLITEEYRQELIKLRKNKTWGNSGSNYYNRIYHYAHKYKCKNVLDYGAGLQAIEELDNTLPNKKYTKKLNVTSYDPGIESIKNNNIPKDFLCCCDVLEHIEPEFLDNVLDDILRCTLSKGFLAISCKEAKTILPDGRNAHLIIEPFTWWRNKLIERGFELLKEEFYHVSHGYLVFYNNDPSFNLKERQRTA